MAVDARQGYRSTAMSIERFQVWMLPLPWDRRSLSAEGPEGDCAKELLMTIWFECQ
jgi:hypothetical protein